MSIFISEKYTDVKKRHFESFLKYRKKRIKINQMEIQHEITTYYCFIKYQGKMLNVSKLKNCTKYFRQLEMPIIMQ